MDHMDRILTEQAEAFVLEDKREDAAGISPWESSITSILWGFLLISFHINLFGFPPEFAVNVLGFLLILRGFCRLTAKSGWLKAGLAVALISVVTYEVWLVISCTPLVLPEFLTKALTVWQVINRFLLFGLLYRGLPPFIENETKRQEAADKLKTVLSYLAVSFVLLLLGMFFSGSLFGWIIAALYLFFLYQIYAELDGTRTILQEYGYRLTPLGGRGVALMRGLIFALVLFLGLGMPTAMYRAGQSPVIPISEETADGSDRVLYQTYFSDLFQHSRFQDSFLSEGAVNMLDYYFADPSAEAAGSSPVLLEEDRIAAIQAGLISAGIPEDIVTALPASEISRYEGVTAVYSPTNTLPGEASDISVSCRAYLCRFEGTDICRALVYGSWQEMPKGRYTDAILFYLRNYESYAKNRANLIRDLTGAVIGEEEGKLSCSRMTASGYLSREVLLLTFPVPKTGNRYDFYLGFNFMPDTAEDEENPGTFRHTAILPFNLYHREKLWCFPYQHPIEAFEGNDSLLFGYSDNRLYSTSSYYSPFFEFTTEAP